MQYLEEGGRGMLETSPQAKHRVLSVHSHRADVKAGETEGNSHQ